MIAPTVLGSRGGGFLYNITHFKILNKFLNGIFNLKSKEQWRQLMLLYYL